MEAIMTNALPVGAVLIDVVMAFSLASKVVVGIMGIVGVVALVVMKKNGKTLG